MTNKKQHLLVLDLNGNLLLSKHRKIRDAYTNKLIEPHARAGAKHVYFRPHMREFLRFCFENFYVAIWSSNADWNVHAITQLILTPQQRMDLIFCWGRSHCLVNRSDYSSEKDVRRVFAHLARVKLPLPASAVTIIDDSPQKIINCQHANNYIQVPEFDVARECDTDTHLTQLRQDLQIRFL